MEISDQLQGPAALTSLGTE